jgi:uncharacterized protein YegP (UPF0339 family)
MKFEIWKSQKNKKFYFNLKARNGQVILTSQGYANKSGVKNGVNSVQKNCSNDNCFEKKVAKNGKHHFNLLSSNKKIIGSSQMYASKSSMESGIRAVKRVAPDAIVVELEG